MKNKKYNIIYADPPWQYKAQGGKRGSNHQYNVMSITDIMLLPVQELAAKNCTLFLWVTNPLLIEGIATLKAWGFEYKTVAFNWVKLNKKPLTVKKMKEAYEKGKPIIKYKNNFYTPFMGMGHKTRANTELCLIGTKGKPKRVSASVTQEILAPIREHSRKPDEAREKIIQLMGNKKRIELFARQKHKGWDAFGNEIESDIIL